MQPLIYYADINGVAVDSRNLSVSETRKQGVARLRVPMKRKQAIGAELLLQRMMRELEPDWSFPVQYEQDPAGKPYFETIYFQRRMSAGGDGRFL